MLSARELFLFCEKTGPFFGGVPPVVAPEGNLGFKGKPSCPFYRTGDVYMVATNWGAGNVVYNKRLGSPS
jgi:hypothetical protein